jgi:RHS repeat-associated protein
VTSRGAPTGNIWTTTTPTYSHPLASDYTTPTVLQSSVYTPDPVGNPVSITDSRVATEWPASAQPVPSTSFHHNDLYALTSVSRTIPTNSQESPFTSADPSPINYSYPTMRATTLTFGYDWQGNLKSSTDESNKTFQRSMGTGTFGTGTSGPNQLRSGTSPQGAYTNAYDASGNLTQIVSTGLGTSGGDTLNLTMTYDWDEAGRLRAAERAEAIWAPATSGLCVRGHTCDPASPAHQVGTTVTIQNSYVYDGGGQRIVHASSNSPSGETTYSLEIFSSLRVNGAEFMTWANDYQRTELSESVYLVASGISYGRVVSDSSLPSPSGCAQHVFIEISDSQGSTSSVIDRETSELVEQATYLPFGQVDTDYRPDRWNGFREGYRYTGKEDDYEVGLTYFGARYYSELLSRWASADPLSIHSMGSDLNPYRFVHNSPMSQVDPTGLKGISDEGGDDSDDGQDEDPDPRPATNIRIRPYFDSEFPPGCGDQGQLCQGNVPDGDAQLINAMRGEFKADAPGPGPAIGGVMDVVGSDTDEAVETPMQRAVNAFHDTVDDLTRLAEAGFLAGAAIDGVAAIGGALGGGVGAFGGGASAGGAILAGAEGGAAIIGGAVFAPEAILLIGVAVAGVAVVGIAMAVAHSGGGGDSSLSRSDQRSISSLQRRMDEHQAKLDAYKENPDAYDNKGYLRNAPNEQIRQRIIDTRINHLQTEIDEFQFQINQLRGIAE